MEEWTGPDADEAGRGYAAKVHVPASLPLALESDVMAAPGGETETKTYACAQGDPSYLAASE